jgi:hypothetical protein
MAPANSGEIKKRRTILNVVIAALVIALVSTSVLAGLFYHNYESTLASEPRYAYPQFYIQSLNTSILQGPFENGGNASLVGAEMAGMPVYLSWPAHISGPLNYNGPVYFFIVWSTQSFPSRSSNVISEDRNWSVYFIGPGDNLTISVSLPPGSYTFWIAGASPSPATGIAHITVDYSYFAP